jgi:ribosomal protein L7/L12
MAPEAGEFNLIVVEVESAKLADAARQFGHAFNLDETIATQVCKSAPIIFAQKLTKQEVKAITPALGDLSRAGIEFRVTARVAGKLPKVNWPVRPQFTAAGVTGAVGLSFEWNQNAFVCPGCGESFLFRRVGKVELSEPASAVGSNGAEAAAAAAAPAMAARAAAPQPVESTIGASTMDFAEAAMPAPRAVGVEGVAPLAGEGESLDLPETLDELKLAGEPAPEAPEEPLLPEAEPLAPADQPLEELSGSDGGFAADAEPLAPTEPEALPEVPLAEPEAAPVEEEAPAEAGELYNVFLSKITDTSKRDKAAELIAKVKGCSTSEAKELTTRLVIPLAKNVSKNKAEDILNQFKKLKIFGRMTKVK